MNKCKLSEKDRCLTGLCGGVAEYYGFDPFIVRIVAISLFIFKPFYVIIFYFILSLLLSKQK